MALVRAQVTFQHTSGLAEDVVSNTWHFTTLSNPPSPAELVEIGDLVEDFYTAGATPLYTFFSNEMAQNGHEITFYDLGDPAPRVPLDTRTFNLPAAPNGDPLPGEVALVVSFQGAQVSGEAQARKRGRLYIGRLDKDSASAGRPAGALITSAVAAGTQALSVSDLSANIAWVVYSPTSATGGDPTPFSVVDNGWVDNAFDTQRRRGLAATARTTY